MQPLFSVVVVICVVFALATADYRDDALALHNQYRAKYHAPPLALNATLNNYAQNWANYMAKEKKLVHSKTKDPKSKYGENIYMSGNLKLSDSDAVKSATTKWFDENKDYKFNNLFSSVTGHFTQVVWKSSKYLGIGIARSDKGVYVCANYDPAGNCLSQFLQNVLRP